MSKSKPKEIVRAEQLLALAAYNPEGEEARSAAMALVKHMIRHGLTLTVVGYEPQPPATAEVHYQPAPTPPAAEPRKAPQRPRKTRHKPEPQPAPERSRQAPRTKAKPRAAGEPPVAEPRGNPDQMDLFPRTFVAVAKGTCIHCRRPFVAGDHISWMAGAGATHDVCSSKYRWPIGKA